MLKAKWKWTVPGGGPSYVNRISKAKSRPTCRCRRRNSGDPSEDVEGQTPDGATAMRAPNHKDGAGSRSPTARHLDLPDEPSIAVLPFTNLSGDPSQDYFADGVVEDLTVALGRIH